MRKHKDDYDRGVELFKKVSLDYYNKYYYFKTGKTFSQTRVRTAAVSSPEEIDESVSVISIIESRESFKETMSERSDTPISFGSEPEFDNLLFEIKA